MADIGTFPTIRNVLESGENILQYTAGAALKAGMVVAFHGTGVSRTVHPCVKGTTGMPVGVVIYDVSSGDEAAIAGPGCTAKVANFSDSVAIDAGDLLEPDDNAVGGTVHALALLGALAMLYSVGYAVDDIAASDTGFIMVQPQAVIDATS